MSTIRVTVNAYGCHKLDAKLDIGGTDNTFDLIKMMIQQVIPDYSPTDDFWKDAVKEALNDESHYHYWGDLIVSLYYKKGEIF
nr:MAG TPA: hypothetical protein [Caudoviricetes sp.]